MNWGGSKLCLSFLRELFEGVHDFRLHDFRLALYTDEAHLDENTTVYTETGELPPIRGYVTGGRSVVMHSPPLIAEGVALVPFETVEWKPAEFKARGGLVYNASAPGYPSVCVLDFGIERESNGNNFAVQFRGADPRAAVLRLRP